MRYGFIALIAALTAAADQYTKHLAVAAIGFADTIRITDFFNLVHVRNHGAAFGFLNNPDTRWQVWFFLGTTLLALGVIAYLAKKAGPAEYALFTALGLVSGGAVGNAVDRIWRKSVVDFFDLHLGDWHWPAFNVADVAICAGAVLIFLLMFTKPQSGKTT